MEKVGVVLEEDGVPCGDAIHLSAQWLQVYAGGRRVTVEDVLVAVGEKVGHDNIPLLLE